MTAPRTCLPRARRTALTTAAVGLTALAVAPTALADSYADVAPTPTTAVVEVAQAPQTEVLAVKHAADPNTLAYTGFEAGSVAVAGLGLVAGGVLLIRGGRRRAGSEA